MWTVRDKSLTYEQLKQDAEKAQKDLHLVGFTFPVFIFKMYQMLKINSQIWYDEKTSKINS